jgi:hypothetical protein
MLRICLVSLTGVRRYLLLHLADKRAARDLCVDSNSQDLHKIVHNSSYFRNRARS